MKKTVSLLLLGLFALTAPALHAANKNEVGIVSLDRCLNESKYGVQEQNGFEALQKQFSGTIEAIDQELAEIDEKAKDEDYIDSLSQEAEDEMRMRFQQLLQTRSQQENQAMQILNQERYRLISGLNTEVMRASQIIAKENKLEMVLRDEAAFFYKGGMDITDQVIVEMNKLFDVENKEAE